MPAGIVYEGVVPQDGGGGTLFKGIKFWVAHSIPNRSICIQNIQNNGGEVVRVDKHADYLLADHARRDVPPGSYSWKVIDDCMEDGTLKPIDDYLRPPAHEPRPVGSSLPQKGTRTAFNAEEDRILAKWVAKHENMGISIKGNSIYKELELKYPRHTWQSWRNRYMQKLSYLPRLPVSDGEEASPSQSPAPPPQNLASDAPSDRSPKRRHVAAQSASASGSRNPFTDEDDSILLEYVRECIRNGKPISGNKIYEDLAQDFPQHTMHSWRDRSLRHLKPLWENTLEDEREVDDSTPKERASRVERAGNTSRIPRQVTEDPPQEEAPGEEQLVEQTAPLLANEGEDGDEDDDGYEQEQPPELSRIPTSPLRSQEPREEVSSDNQSPSSSGLFVSQVERAILTEETDLKKQFNADYQAYADNLNRYVHWWPTIKGKTFDLWQLWQAVKSQEMDPEERDWQQISEVLGFNWVENDSIPDEVRRCYETNLAEFEATLMEFDDGSDEDGEEETQHNTAALAGTSIRSSPPALSSLKRSYDTALGPSHGAYPNSSPKRPRHNQDEVPSTPDEKNGTSHLRRGTFPGPTPMNLLSPNLGSRETLHRTPHRRAVEPETQDFRYDPETQAVTFESQGHEEVESQINITPSQQLQSEYDARSGETPVTPTPARRARNPFLEEEDMDEAGGDPDEPDESDLFTPRASTTSVPTMGSSPIQNMAKPKRRTLPSSFAQSHSRREKKSIPASQPSSAAEQSPPARPQQKPQSPARDSHDDIIDFYMSLGYGQDVVIRALDSTNWVPGLASQVMETLKKGESLPSNWRGVWTQKDDEALRLIRADSPAQNTKEARKRDKQRGKLEKKHTREGMDMRIKFLEAIGIRRKVRFVEDGESKA